MRHRRSPGGIHRGVSLRVNLCGEGGGPRIFAVGPDKKMAGQKAGFRLHFGPEWLILIAVHIYIYSYV